MFKKNIADALGTDDGYLLQQKFKYKGADIPWKEYLGYKRHCLDSSDAIEIGKLIAEARREDRIEAIHWARYLIAMYKDDLIRLVERHSFLERRIVLGHLKYVQSK